VAGSFESALFTARERSDDEAALSDFARTALAQGQEEAALPLLRDAAGRLKSARLWQWTALLERSLDEHERAVASFDTAAALAPGDASIAHGRARIALEAGLPAEALFQTALELAPADGGVLLGYVAALLAAGRSEEAERTLDRALEGSPLWAEGHMQLAHLRSRLGKTDRTIASLERAIQRHPRNEQLWVTLFRIHLQTQNFAALDATVDRARPHLPREALLSYEAIAASELAETERADRLFTGMSANLRRSVEVYWIRHQLRAGRLAQACASIDAALKTDMAAEIWPYAAIAWRLAGDPRLDWLEGDLDRLVSVVDLTSQLPDMEVLEQSLRKLHVAKGEYLDQSVRGGSQTDGPLMTRTDPVIRALRKAILGAVGKHVRQLPPVDPAHPLLGRRSGERILFSGSWSVLLRAAGYHANHVHPQGWISSALYVRLPPRSAADAGNAGWLTIGEPQAELGLDLAPLREIQPRPGRLVLFPSYTWHGTRPFSSGDRLTVAFDVKPPV
jgi:Tfp pilus assembly protein PilF